MNRITKQLKLYRFVTMAKLLPRFWRKSEQIASANGVATHTVFTDMLKCLVKYGASEENYEQFHFYGSDEEYRDAFITWRRNMAIMYKFNTAEVKELFLNKVKWNKRFAKYVKRDWIYSAESSKEQIVAFLHAHSTVIVKAIEGACGVGIDKYDSKDILDDKNLLNRICLGEYVIENGAVNIDDVKKISPKSLNTIRVVTCVDSKGNVNIVTTALRVGNGHSYTDNICTGGIACGIDMQTGIVVTDGMDHEGNKIVMHPVSKIPFKGIQIPLWEDVLQVVFSLAKEFTEARFVGWDIVLTTNGIDVLEGNIPPDEGLCQIDLAGRYHQVMLMY